MTAAGYLSHVRASTAAAVLAFLVAFRTEEDQETGALADLVALCPTGKAAEVCEAVVAADPRLAGDVDYGGDRMLGTDQVAGEG